jgi:hypothetical protein
MPVSPARRCTSFAPGHEVNPDAALHRANHPVYAAADRAGWVVRIEREVIVVAFDGGTIGMFRNHDTVRLGGLIVDHGPRVAFSPHHRPLRLEHDEGAYCFNVADDTGEPLASCGDGRVSGSAPLRSPAMNSRRPSAVVYGLHEHHQSFALFDADEAATLADEYRALWACRTRGDLLALLPSLRLVQPPVEPEDLLGTESDPLDWRKVPGIPDGDWPPMATANALQLFTSADPIWADPIWADLGAEAGAEVERTVFNGDYVSLPVEHESALIAVLARHGITATRDDDLIALTEVPG